MQSTWRSWLLPAAVLLCFAPVADARPPYVEKLADYFGHYLPRSMKDCRVCHQDGSGEDRPHNPFGARLKAVRAERAKTGLKDDIISCLEAILAEDSDGDGAANGLELLSGHFPGDPADIPSAAELARAKKAWAAFQAAGPSPPWPLFQPVRRPSVPAVRNTARVRNPIDAFLAVEYKERGLTPRPEAPRSLLLRRVFLDLIGLPPTREEIEAFVHDPDPDAYEKAVDRLLSSPRYGERWARHWLDVWRYADWAGFGAEIRESQPNIWQWRDWVVESLNQDKGYDRMVLEMLAGDELAPEDADVLRGTGFLVRQYFRFDRDTWLDGTVEHTAKAFLGVTLNCARCHDHPFDTAIRQEQYYQFRAFFEPYRVRQDAVKGALAVKDFGLPRVYDAAPAAPTYLYLRGDVLRPDRSRVMTPAVPPVLGGPEIKITPVSLPPAAYAPDNRPFVLPETIAASAGHIPQARAEAEESRRSFAAAVCLLAGPTPVLVGLPAARAALDTLAGAELEVSLAEARNAALLAVLRAEQLEDAGKKGSDEWKQAATRAGTEQRNLAVLEARQNLRAARGPLADPGAAESAAKALAQAEAAAKAAPSAAYTKRPVRSYPTTSSGRRLALARWIVDRQNPLAARVAVNHIWLRHFGQALVPSVFDFGRNGQLPTHPELLDWLADEFQEHGWSMKHLHRLIVTSAAYRMASTTDAGDAGLDPDNVYLWRMNARRMEAEVVRDSVLSLGGQLDLTMGGPDIDHNLGLTVPRRSLYFRCADTKQMGFLNTFDGPSVVECYRRPTSVVPQQALALANSALVQDQARRLALALTKEVGDQADTAFIRAAFVQVLGREPSGAEQADCAQFLAEQSELLKNPRTLTPCGAGLTGDATLAPGLRARVDLVHVLMNHNDFVTIR